MRGNAFDEIPQSYLHRKDNFVLNRGEEKVTAEPSLFPPPIHDNTCHSERREESQTINNSQILIFSHIPSHRVFFAAGSASSLPCRFQ